MLLCKWHALAVCSSAQRLKLLSRQPLPYVRKMTIVNQVQRPDERVQIVDEANNLTGAATRAEMRAKNLIHRCSFIMVFNKQVIPLHYLTKTNGLKEYSTSYSTSGVHIIN